MLSDHYKGGMTERLLVSIITVDPSGGRIEVVGKDAAVIQVAVGPQTPALFRWPVQGELWTIIRENGVWGLESLVPGPDDTPLASLNPGDGIVQTETIWTPSGDHLVVKTEMDTAVTSLTNLISALKSSQIYTITSFGTDRSLDATTMTINEIATVLATLINDLKATGIIT